MIKLGLTGSIGMGKTTTARMFAALGCPVYDADKAVHDLYLPGGAAVGPIEAEFPGTTDKLEGVDRNKLRDKFIQDSSARKRLETIVHPLVFQARQEFENQQLNSGAVLVVFDIPLLFETGSDAEMDFIAVVSAPFSVQKERVLARPGMDEDTFSAILQKQMPDSLKREKADFVIQTGLGLTYAKAQVDAIVDILTEKPIQYNA